MEAVLLGVGCCCRHPLDDMDHPLGGLAAEFAFQHAPGWLAQCAVPFEVGLTGDACSRSESTAVSRREGESGLSETGPRITPSRERRRRIKRPPAGRLAFSLGVHYALNNAVSVQH